MTNDVLGSSGLTDADWAEINKLRRAHEDGGQDSPTGKRNGNYRHGTRTKEAIQAVRLVNLLSRLARKS